MGAALTLAFAESKVRRQSPLAKSISGKSYAPTENEPNMLAVFEAIMAKRITSSRLSATVGFFGKCRKSHMDSVVDLATKAQRHKANRVQLGAFMSWWPDISREISVEVTHRIRYL